MVNGNAIFVPDGAGACARRFMIHLPSELQS